MSPTVKLSRAAVEALMRSVPCCSVCRSPATTVSVQVHIHGGTDYSIQHHCDAHRTGVGDTPSAFAIRESLAALKAVSS